MLFYKPCRIIDYNYEETFIHNSKVDSGINHGNCHQDTTVNKVSSHQDLAWVHQVAEKSFKVVLGILYRKVSTHTNLSLNVERYKLLQNMSCEEVSTYFKMQPNVLVDVQDVVSACLQSSFYLQCQVLMIQLDSTSRF